MAFVKTAKDPFITPVGLLIANSTNGILKSEDWGQFMNICDVINTTADGPKDAVKALKRKITKNYNQKEVRFSLSLLEMCMENCNTSFQTMVLKKDFCKDVLVKLLNPKYNLPVNTQNRILRFIMAWATNKKGNVDLSEIKELYLELIKKGIQFPSLEDNEEIAIEVQKTSHQVNASDRHSTTSCIDTALQNLTPEQIGKLYSELDMVRINVSAMSQILLENQPGAETPQDMELLQDLHKACQEMQARILKLLEIVQNEDVIIELVQVNDDLNNIFLRYKRYSRTRGKQSDDNIKQNGLTNGNNRPSAPSSELIELNLDPLPSTQNQTNGIPLPASTGVPDPAAPVTQHRVHTYDNGSSLQPQESHTTSMYPQMDLLELREAVNTPFAFGVQSQLTKLPPRPLYDNVPLENSFLSSTQSTKPLFPGVQNVSPFYPADRFPAPSLPPIPNSTPLLPVNVNLLPAIPTLNPTIVPMKKEPTSNPVVKSDDSNNSETLPNYYELLEFDPLSESNGTEAIYEEIDTTSWKQKKESGC